MWSIWWNSLQCNAMIVEQSITPSQILTPTPYFFLDFQKSYLLSKQQHLYLKWDFFLIFRKTIYYLNNIIYILNENVRVTSVVITPLKLKNLTTEYNLIGKTFHLWYMGFRFESLMNRWCCIIRLLFKQKKNTIRNYISQWIKIKFKNSSNFSYT